MKIETMKAMLEFLEALQPVVNTYDERGYDHPELDGAFGTIMGELEKDINDAEKLLRIWGITADHAVLARIDKYNLTKEEMLEELHGTVGKSFENVTVFKNGKEFRV